MSPHLAAELAGATIEPARAGRAARARPRERTRSSAEGVGGLLVPLTPGYLVRDLALDLGLPLVVAARPGLGTINHTLLTIEAARAAGLRVAGVVMTPWPDEPDGMRALEPRDDRAARRACAVSGLPPTAPATRSPTRARRCRSTRGWRIERMRTCVASYIAGHRPRWSSP